MRYQKILLAGNSAHIYGHFSLVTFLFWATLVYGHIWRILKFAILAVNCRFGPEKLVAAAAATGGFILHQQAPETA